MDKVKLPKGVTQVQVDSWKRSFENVQLFSTKDRDGKPYSCILRGANRKTVSMANSYDDTIKRNEMLLKELWLAGDEKIKTDDYLFLGISAQIDDVLEVAEVEVKKL